MNTEPSRDEVLKRVTEKAHQILLQSGNCRTTVKTVPKSVIEKCTTQAGSYSPLGRWPNGDQGGTHGHRDVA